MPKSPFWRIRLLTWIEGVMSVIAPASAAIDSPGARRTTAIAYAGRY